jgi:hypothetical protein
MITLRRMRWVGYVVYTVQMRNMYKGLIRKPEGKKPFGRPRPTDWMIMDLQEIGWKSVYYIHVFQYRDRCQAIVNTIINL